jgi:D-arabinose 1-dehydrogenase-like Zn-dependent alcohol dehydrogenase
MYVSMVTEVLVAIKSNGVCTTDIHCWQHGGLPGLKVVKGVTKPFIVGHEAVGVVTELGEGVTTLKIGMM